MMIVQHVQPSDTTEIPESSAAGSGPAGPNVAKEKSKGIRNDAARKRRRNGLTAQRTAAKPPAKTVSKQDRVLSMLRRKEGVSIAAIMKAIGWQKHSVHGFLAGVVRKKLALNLKSDGVDGKRIYRIVSGKLATAPASKRKRSR